MISSVTPQAVEGGWKLSLTLGFCSCSDSSHSLLINSC